ncbi:MAG: CPBP family intramembrane metalloprotease [Firmicutes bacterium]|nr:CPBP family intramembrane metalloprotease [Bacillota bacterium]
MEKVFAELQHNVRDGKIKLNGLILLLLYLVPFYYIDSVGFLCVISSLALLNLFYSPVADLYDHRQQKNKTAYLALVIGSIVFTIVQSQLFYMKKLDHGLLIGEIPLIPTFTTVFYLLFPAYWLIVNLDERGAIFKINRKSLTFTLLACLPLIFANITLYVRKFDLLSDQTMILCSAFQALIMAAFIEELFYRAFLYGVLRKIVSVPMAQVISGLTFSLSHLVLVHQFFDTYTIRPVLSLAALFLLGVFYAQVYERTKSIWPSIIYHAIMNGFILYMIQLVLG